MTPGYLDYFFNKKSDVFKELTLSQKLALHNLYHGEGYRKVLPPLDRQELSLLSHRNSIRFPFFSRGEIQAVKPSSLNRAVVRDVSRGGLSLYTDMDLSRNKSYTLGLGLGHLHASDIIVQPVWRKNRTEYGCILIDSDQEWHRMIHHLEDCIVRLGNNGPADLQTSWEKRNP